MTEALHAPLEILESFGALADTKIPLLETALQLAALSHEGRSLPPYRLHIEKLRTEISDRHQKLLDAGADDDCLTQIAAVKHILCDAHGYRGDTESYNDLRNADMIEVIDRRKGLPISLTLLALEIVRPLGWTVEGINFPAHFLLRFDKDGQRILCDPFHGFAILQAADMRQLLKKTLGEKAELSPSYYQEATNRDILLRLQNNIKFRQIETEHYAEALETVRIMRLFAPEEIRLLLDDGVLKARLGRTKDAIDSVRDYLRRIQNPKDRADAELLLIALENGL